MQPQAYAPARVALATDRPAGTVHRDHFLEPEHQSRFLVRAPVPQMASPPPESLPSGVAVLPSTGNQTSSWSAPGT